MIAVLIDSDRALLYGKEHVQKLNLHQNASSRIPKSRERSVRVEQAMQGVTFRGSKNWLNQFSAYKKLASMKVGYLDLETMNIVDTQMYIDGYQVKLVSDTSYGSLWEVSFTLKAF